MIAFPLGVDEKAEVTVRPSRNFDMGVGSGKPVTKQARGGVTGIVLDGRGRPLVIPQNDAERIEAMRKWLVALGLVYK